MIFHLGLSRSTPPSGRTLKKKATPFLGRPLPRKIGMTPRRRLINNAAPPETGAGSEHSRIIVWCGQVIGCHPSLAIYPQDVHGLCIVDADQDSERGPLSRAAGEDKGESHQSDTRQTDAKRQPPRDDPIQSLPSRLRLPGQENCRLQRFSRLNLGRQREVHLLTLAALPYNFLRNRCDIFTF